MENRKRLFIRDVLKKALREGETSDIFYRTDCSALTRGELRNLIENIEDNDIILTPFE